MAEISRRVRITDRDRLLLSFAAEHRIVLGAHISACLGVSPAVALARSRALVAAGFLRRHALAEAPGRCYSITTSGLRVAGSDLPAPRFDAHGYRHDVGLAWLWLAARAGAFGAHQGLVSERRMRSADAAEAHAARGGGTEPFAIRLGGTGPGGRERLHYPDLLLIGADGSRVAVELELTPKSRTRRERILAGYGADRRVDGVLYVVDRAAVGRSIARSADRLGGSARVRIQSLQWGRQTGSREPALSPRRRRVPAAGKSIEAGR